MGVHHPPQKGILTGNVHTDACMCLPLCFDRLFRGIIGENERDQSSAVNFEDTSSNGTDNEMDISMDSSVSGATSVSSQSTLSASSIMSSLSSDSVRVGSTSDRFVHIIHIVVIVFCDDLLKTNLCYIVLIFGFLIFTVVAAAVLSY